MIRDAMSALMIGVACFWSVGDVSGQNADAPGRQDSSKGDSGEIGFLNVVELLSGERYSARQQAMREVWRNREGTQDAVRRAAQGSDPEVAERAQWVLDQWQRGILHDTPQELLQRVDAANPMAHLMDQGLFDAVLVALEAADGTLASAVTRQQISELLSARFPFYVRTALENQQVSKLLMLLDVAADSKELALCRVQLLQLQGIDLQNENLLPKAAENWSREKRDETHILLLVHLGMVDEAIGLARKQVDSGLLNQCLMLESQWSELAEDAVAKAREAETGSYDSVQLWSRVLVSAERSGIEPLRVEAINELSVVAVDEAAKTRDLRWKSLASHGQLDAALAIADQLSPDSSAAVSIAASRPARAFKVLGYPLELVDIKSEVWADQALKAQADNFKNRFTPGFKPLTPEFRRLLALVRCLLSIGRDDVAWSIADRLCRSKGVLNSVPVRAYVLSTLTMTNRREWLESLALTGDVEELSPNSKYLIAKSLNNCDVRAFDRLLKSVGTVKQDADYREQVSIVCQMFRGDTPPDYDVESGLAFLYDEIMQQLQEQQLQEQRRGQTRAVSFNLNIAKLFAIHGEPVFASRYVEAFANHGDVNAMLDLGEWELTGGRIQKAAEWFDAIQQLSRRSSFIAANRGMQGSGVVSEVDLAAIKALVGQWVIARRLEDKQLVASLRKELEHVLCSPSTSFRMAVADYLRERGEFQLAKQVYKVLLPVAVLAGGSDLDLYEASRKYVQLTQEKHPLEAARWFDLAVGRILQSTHYRPSAYITLPLLIQHWRLDGAIRASEGGAVEKSLKRLLELDPMDISFAENLLPEMRKSGMEELADSTLDGIIDAGLAYADRFSLDAMTCNNVAWVAAKNGRRLEDALSLANRAVTVKPDSAIYRDTLAEVLFLLGRTTEALQIEQACLLDDPDQWHLHEQIQKYRQALDKDDS